MVTVNNNWLKCLNWLNKLNISYYIKKEFECGMGYCDESQVEIIRYKTPMGIQVLISRPIESLNYEKNRIIELKKAMSDIDIVSKMILVNEKLIDRYTADLFKWGLNPDMSDATEESKEFGEHICI